MNRYTVMALDKNNKQAGGNGWNRKQDALQEIRLLKTLPSAFPHIEFCAYDKTGLLVAEIYFDFNEDKGTYSKTEF